MWGQKRSVCLFCVLSSRLSLSLHWWGLCRTAPHQQNQHTTQIKICENRKEGEQFCGGKATTATILLREYCIQETRQQREKREKELARGAHAHRSRRPPAPPEEARRAHRPAAGALQTPSRGSRSRRSRRSLTPWRRARARAAHGSRLLLLTPAACAART